MSGILNQTKQIRIATAHAINAMTLDQLTLRAAEMARAIDAAAGTLLQERVRLGAVLWQVRAALGRGEWGVWLGAGALHQKTARKCMSMAAALADTRGELDRDKLFAAMHAADPGAFASIEEFDEQRLSLSRVERAIGIRSEDASGNLNIPNVRGKWNNCSIISASGDSDDAPDNLNVPNVMGKWNNCSIFSAAGHSDDAFDNLNNPNVRGKWNNCSIISAPGHSDDASGSLNNPNVRGKWNNCSINSGAGALPVGRVGDVAGQGVLAGLFAPITRQIETMCRVYDTLSTRQRGRLRKLNDFYERKSGEILRA